MFKKIFLLTLGFTHLALAQKPCTFLFAGTPSEEDICLHVEHSGFEQATVGKIIYGGVLTFYFWKTTDTKQTFINLKNSGYKINVAVNMPFMFESSYCAGNAKLNEPAWITVSNGVILQGKTTIEPGMYTVAVLLTRPGKTVYERPVRKIDISEDNPVYHKPDKFIFERLEEDSGAYLFLVADKNKPKAPLNETQPKK